MSTEPRAALDRLIAAFEGHLRALEARVGDDDSVVDRAYMILADAYESYDEALSENFDESTPLTVEDDDFDDEDLEFMDDDVTTDD